MPILRQWAERHPDKTAALVAFSNQAITYGELDRRANAVTQLLIWMGLAAGDGIAIMLDNDPTYFELIWGARRHGVYYTPVSTHLKPEEAAYIVRDSGAKLFFVAARFVDAVQALLADNPHRCTVYALGGALDGSFDYAAELARFDRPIEIPDGPVGKDFFYSSGTTGKPKGIKRRYSPIFDKPTPPATGSATISALPRIRSISPRHRCTTARRFVSPCARWRAAAPL